MCLFLLALWMRVMLKVFVNVTIGIGEVIHKSKADARLVSWGFISFMFVPDLMIRQKKTAMQILHGGLL